MVAFLCTAKSKALPIGAWNMVTDGMGTSCLASKNFGHQMPADSPQHRSKYLQFQCCHHQQSRTRNVPQGPVMASTDLFTRTYFVIGLWYCTQILAISADSAGQINLTATWFIWQAAAFRIPLSTLYRAPREGGLALIDTQAKCLALFISICYQLFQLKEAFTVDWLQAWFEFISFDIPLNLRLIPTGLNSLRRFFQEMTYISQWHGSPSGPGSPYYRGFTVTLRHTTLSRIPLDEWSAPRTGLYLTTSNTHNRETPMPPLGFEPTIPASGLPKIHALDRAATGICDELYSYTTAY
jgi:hypothetical protein